MAQISSHKMKKLIRHMCIVTKHYHDREKAKRNLGLQLKKLKSSKDIERDLGLLNKKVNLLLDVETKIISLGSPKAIPKAYIEKISILEKELNLIKEERDNLLDENKSLKEVVDSHVNLNEDIEVHKQKTDTRIQKIENHVSKHIPDKKLKISLLHGKISALEASYKKISRSRKVSPKRLNEVKNRIKLYKDKLIKL